MPRYPWPPDDFVCLYEHTCPYLDGLSTTWVLDEYRRADDVYQEHLRIIDSFSEALGVSEKRVRALERENLTTFLRIPGVVPTNNHAEQSLRKMVIFRKICFGTRSDTGLKNHSIIPTLVQAARRQGVHPREFLHILHTADTAMAQAALYNNSS
ncbi:MAG: transposase [Desulfobulbales bacterium]|nr:transposase [Desulfobulbales bacterium]